MKKQLKTTIGITTAAVTLAASSTFGATLFDSQGFEAPTYNLGNLVGQNGWVVDPAANSGVAQVQNTVFKTGSQAVRMSGGSTTWAWPDLGYTPAAGEFVRVSFDVQRSSFGAANNFGYFVDIYDTTGARIARSGLTRTGTSTAPGSVQALATIGGATPGSFLIGSPLLNNTWYSFAVDLNFTADTYDVRIDGSLISAGLPFVVAANGVGDADLQLSGATGATDSGYFDNYMVEALVIPEPTAMSLVLLGLAGLGGRAWLGRRQV